jgi:UDP-N-acetylmuramyl pentapeptide synthase
VENLRGAEAKSSPRSTLSLEERHQVQQIFGHRHNVKNLSALAVAKSLGLPFPAVNAFWEELLSSAGK